MSDIEHDYLEAFRRALAEGMDETIMSDKDEQALYDVEVALRETLDYKLWHVALALRAVILPFLRAFERVVLRIING